MQTFATDLIERAQQQRSILRREVCLTEVNELRLAFSRAINYLRETNDEDDIDFASSLSVYRNRLLTEPVEFRVYSKEVLKLLSTLYAPQHYSERFYQDFKQLTANLEAIADKDNPLHDVIAQDIEESAAGDSKMRIWCYAQSKRLYQEIARQSLNYELDDDWFVHSVSMYSGQRPFDELLLVGPMRSRGWNRLPDAVVSAPRFQTIKQIVWDGMIDDPELGYDPVLGIQRQRQSQTQKSAVSSTKAPGESTGSPFAGAFTSSVQRLGHKSSTENRFEVEDELVWTRRSEDEERLTRAVAISLSDGSHVFWAPRTGLLSYNPNDQDYPVAARSSMVDLAAGMYAIVEVEALRDRETPDDIYASRYTDVWRAKLKERIDGGPKDLLRKLRMRGLNLKTLSTRIHLWADEDAPRKYEHFAILVNELGLTSFDPEKNYPRPGFQFALKAFRVISAGWGRAISHGREVADRIEGKRIEALNVVSAQLHDLARDADTFVYELAIGHEADGILEFDRITAIEHGFIVPNECMQYKIDRLEVDKWRQ